MTQPALRRSFAATLISLSAIAPLAAAAAQDREPATVAPRAAVIETVRVPPPIQTMRVERAEPTVAPAATFLVRVTGAGKDIWTGEMQLENNQGSELRLTLQQADTVCADARQARYSRRQNGLTFNLGYAGRGEGDPFSLSAEWTRPSADCNVPGTRTSGIETRVTVAPGAVKVIEADGGLRIELTRRK